MLREAKALLVEAWRGRRSTEELLKKEVIAEYELRTGPGIYVEIDLEENSVQVSVLCPSGGLVPTETHDEVMLPLARVLAHLPEGLRARTLELRRAAERVPRRRKDGPQTRRTKEALKVLYPPDGRVSDGVSTEIVRSKLNAHLASDSKNRGLRDLSWDTVNRARGRGKKQSS
jgi:hypothetical protein